MSGIKYTYRCTKCGRTEKISVDEPEPLCCEKKMVKDPLDQCTIPEHPEMVRNTDENDACDDGRGKERSDN